MVQGPLFKTCCFARSDFRLRGDAGRSEQMARAWLLLTRLISLRQAENGHSRSEEGETMSSTIQYKTPGVYVTEVDGFPASVVGVETSLPAFVGYTEQANVQGKPVYFNPQKISSFADFVQVFGKGFKPAVQITSVDAATVQENPDAYNVSFVDADGTTVYFAISKSGGPHFNLYASMKLFFENGGGNCYVVSVGDYTGQGATPEGVPVEASKLKKGLAELADIVGPSMLVIPDAVLLKPEDPAKPLVCDAFYDVVNAMKAQCGQLQDRFAILDVYGAEGLDQSDPDTFQKALDAIVVGFRSAIGSENLSYAAAYFPYLKTTTYPASDITYAWFDQAELAAVLTLQAEALYKKEQLVEVKAMISRTALGDGPTKPDEIVALNDSLLNALPVLGEIEKQTALLLGVLPPSAGMAGVYTQVDNSRGVWSAPANVTLASVLAPTVHINDKMQEDLNVPLDGKALDAIREFPGRGTVVWGARTLLGNSRDWRYIQVRRTIIYIEQSIKLALQQFCFSANDSNTWSTVVSSVSNFLNQIWAQGGLLGTTASEAYSVECGLGSTMTEQDILDGIMIVQIRLQMIHPGEFIALTLKQQMEEA